MYREWKEIELCWFGDVQRVERNRIVLVWGCREWKEIELCWFGDVQRMEGNRIVLVWGCTESGRKYRVTQKKWKLLKNPTKIEEIKQHLPNYHCFLKHDY
jgi:hypothetical protein